VYLSFLNDTHAGSGINGEGIATSSPYMVMAAVARSPAIAPIIAVSPTTKFVELNATTVGSHTLDLTILNTGNAALNYTMNVTSDNGGIDHVLINGASSYGGSVAAGGGGEAIVISYDGIGLPDPSEWNWRLELTSNDSTNNPSAGGSAIDILLNVFVSDSWFTCEQDTISTGQYRMSVSSCLGIGDGRKGGSFYRYGDQSEQFYDGSPLIARLDSGTKRVYRDMGWSTVAQRSRQNNQAFRTQSELSIDRTDSIETATGVATTTDSLIQIDWQAIAYRDSSDKQAGMVFEYLVTNRTGGSIDGLSLAAAADYDMDSMNTANRGHSDSALQYVGAMGGTRDGGGIVTGDSNFGAIFAIPLDGDCKDLAVGGRVLNLAPFLEGDNSYNSDSLFDLIQGTSVWAGATYPVDTADDIFIVAVFEQNTSLGPDDSLRFAFGLVQSAVSTADLESRVIAMKTALNPACTPIPCLVDITGDVNVTGALTSADIIAMVNYVFKGGALPEPCEAAGDVNCSGAVTSADIIYMVNHVFKGQVAPCDVCDSVPGTWACP